MLTGQFNFKVGYDLAYNRSGELNAIIDQYNADNEVFLESNMGNLRFTGGLELGVRYSFGNTSFEFSLSNMSRSHEATGIDTLDESEIREFLDYRFNRYSLGYQYKINSFGYGASIGTRKIRIRTDVDGTDVRLTLAEATNYVAKIYLIYEVPSMKSMRMSLIPYMEFPLGDMNIAAVENRIIREPQNTGEIRESFPVFGISFVFYNGPARR